MFIGKNLENIRILNGKSRKDIALALNITEQAVWQYETKNVMPEINKIYEMAKIFNTKTNFFLKNEHILFERNNIDKHRIAFRSLNQIISTKLMNSQSLQAAYLDNFTSYIFSRLKVPHSSILDLVDQIQNYRMNNEDMNRIQLIKHCAKLSRDFLLGEQLSNNNLLFSIEKSGVVVFEKNIDENADAFSLWTLEKRPLIILGSNKGVAVRRNFDIVHELCHLLLHNDIEFDMLTGEEYKEVENEANIFAAEFLMPEEAFIRDVEELPKKSNPDSYISLKEKWRVSIQAMAVRAYNLDLISYQQYRYFWMSINKKGYKKLEPLDNKMLIEKPVKIKSILKMLFDKNVLQLEDILEELKVEIEFLPQITGITQTFFEKYLKNNLKETPVSMINDHIILTSKD